MLLTIIIFFIAIIVAFGMLLYRAWEIRTVRVKIPEADDSPAPDLAFRHVEKSMLYLTKHIVQSIILSIAKWWFIFTTKTKKWLAEKWPKVHNRLEKKPDLNAKPSFVRRAINESKVKIRRVKEKVKEEHGPEPTPSPEEEVKKISSL